MISQLIRQAEKRLTEADIPASYAKYVLNELMLKEKRNLYLEMDKELDPGMLETFTMMMDRLIKDEPCTVSIRHTSSKLIILPSCDRIGIFLIVSTMEGTVSGVSHVELSASANRECIML